MIVYMPRDRFILSLRKSLKLKQISRLEENHQREHRPVSTQYSSIFHSFSAFHAKTSLK